MGYAGEFVAHGSNVNCLALSPTNGRTLVTGGDDRRINLWIVGQPNCLMVCTIQYMMKCEANICMMCYCIEHIRYHISSTECDIQLQ